jgi:hypothetical protein
MKQKLLLLLILVTNFCTVNAQFTESFDGTFPPAGWLNVHSVGTDASAVWEKGEANTFGGDIDNQNNPFFVSPHSGSGMAFFASYDYPIGNGAHLITPAVNLTTGGPHVVSFWMYRDDVYTNKDSVSVYIHTTQSASGATFLGTILRNRTLAPVQTGANGWYQYFFDIPAGFNTATNYITFSAVGSFGNNMFIDDVFVGPKPTCGVPAAILTSNYNHAAGTITLNWTAPTIGTPAGYEWAINTTGTPPASGTSVAGTTANITGITAGVVNYIYVRTNCGSGNFSTWTTHTIAALPCATITTPAQGATNIPQTQTFSWTPVPGATAYGFYLGITAGNEFRLGDTSVTSLPLNNLLPLQTYYWYIVPIINGLEAPTSGCLSNSFTVGPEPTSPANNSCAGAVSITSANNATNPIISTTSGASISLPSEECNDFVGAADDDVWFEFTTPPVASTDSITIKPTATDGIIDIVAQVYAATACNALGSPVICADSTANSGNEVIHFSKLVPNTHYFMRIYSWGDEAADQGGFTLEFSGGSTIPVQLDKFTARRSNGVNIITWSTRQEVNSKYFVVERSGDGLNFNALGQVNAAGNSNAVRNYVYTDRNPLKGDNYYRLRTVDFDNSSRLSDTRRVRNDGIADISIYPNPATDRLTLDINADEATRGNLLIMDVSGKLVYSQYLNLPAGNTILPVRLANISAGSYILKMQLAEDVIVRKFNKQ